jgi:dTDP-4-dehydrorhamnose 3,5-epimerase
MKREELDDRAGQHLSTQDYSKKPTIEGVKLIELRQFIDDGGLFLEVARLTNGALEGIEGFTPRQVSYSQVLPGAIKAFHLHLEQEDVWFVPPYDRLLIGLHDVRKDSASHGVTMRFVMGSGVPRLLVIPRGVAHGCANLGQTPAQILYFVNQQFNPTAPDEHRLPWDFLGEDFWELTRG